MRLNQLNFSNYLIFGFFSLGISLTGYAKLSVITTIPDLKALTQEIGGEYLVVEAIAKGTQDPHSIEAKPSYMVKMSRSDLVIAVGLELEKAWLDPLLRGARNPKIQAGTQGLLEVGPELNPIEQVHGHLSRAEGDVHPLGNPHVLVDQIRVAQAGRLIAKRLGEIDPEHREFYESRAKAIEQRLITKVTEWKKRLDATGIRSVVTYHKTLKYFLTRFGIDSSIHLEPKPGIPPSAGHILSVIEKMKQQNIKWVAENFLKCT